MFTRYVQSLLSDDDDERYGNGLEVASTSNAGSAEQSTDGLEVASTSYAGSAERSTSEVTTTQKKRTSAAPSTTCSPCKGSQATFSPK